VFRLTSSAFKDGQEMAQKYGKKVQNTSPPLAWEGAPEGTRSFALALVDRHPVARNYVHWLVSDIGPAVTSLSEGAAGEPDRWSLNEVTQYAGPFPPSGTHDYEFTLYALKTDKLGVPAGARLEAFTQAAERNSLATARLVGKFTKMR
jgi:Raf kinase inhibitor-like YbhB/YbcL family protein